MNHGPTASTTPRLTTSCKWPNAPKRRSNARRWKSHATFALLPRLPFSATSPQGPPSLTPPDPVALPPPADAPLYPTRRLARSGPSVSALWRFLRTACQGLETSNDRYWSASREPQRSMTSRGYDPRQSPGLGYKRVVSCKDSSHGTDVLAVSEHGAPGRRPNIHTHFVGRQREDGLDTLPARAAEANRSTLIADIPFPARRSQAVRERKTSVLRACRVPNPAKRLNVMQRPKTLLEPQRSITSRS